MHLACASAAADIEPGTRVCLLPTTRLTASPHARTARHHHLYPLSQKRAADDHLVGSPPPRRARVAADARIRAFVQADTQPTDSDNHLSDTSGTTRRHPAASTSTAVTSSARTASPSPSALGRLPPPPPLHAYPPAARAAAPAFSAASPLSTSAVRASLASLALHAAPPAAGTLTTPPSDRHAPGRPHSATVTAGRPHPPPADPASRPPRTGYVDSGVDAPLGSFANGDDPTVVLDNEDRGDEDRGDVAHGNMDRGDEDDSDEGRDNAVSFGAGDINSEVVFDPRFGFVRLVDIDGIVQRKVSKRVAANAARAPVAPPQDAAHGPVSAPVGVVPSAASASPPVVIAQGGMRVQHSSNGRGHLDLSNMRAIDASRAQHLLDEAASVFIQSLRADPIRANRLQLVLPALFTPVAQAALHDNPYMRSVLPSARISLDDIPALVTDGQLRAAELFMQPIAASPYTLATVCNSFLLALLGYTRAAVGYRCLTSVVVMDRLHVPVHTDWSSFWIAHEVQLQVWLLQRIAADECAGLIDRVFYMLAAAGGSDAERLKVIAKQPADRRAPVGHRDNGPPRDRFRVPPRRTQYRPDGSERGARRERFSDSRYDNKRRFRHGNRHSGNGNGGGNRSNNSNNNGGANGNGGKST